MRSAQYIATEISLKLLGDYIAYEHNDKAFKIIKAVLERHLDKPEIKKEKKK